MPGSPCKEAQAQYASPPCYAGEVDQDYLWAPCSPPTGGTQETAIVAKPRRGSPPKAS